MAKKNTGLLGSIVGDLDDSLKKGAAAAKKPAKRKPRATTAAKPSAGFVGNAGASVLGVVSGTARAAQQGKGPAATKRTVERDTARYRRQSVLRDYLDAPRAERSKQAAAASRRVAAGRGSAKDKLIVATHARRTKHDAGRSRSAVSKANAAHDRSAAAREGTRAVLALADQIGKKRFTVSSKDDGGSLLEKVGKVAAAPIVEPAKGAAKLAGVAGDAAVGGANLLEKASKLRLPGTSDGPKEIRGGFDPGDAAKALAVPVKVAGSVTKVAADDPSQISRAAKDIASMVKDLPAGAIQAAKDPKGALSATLKDYKRRYGPLVAGNDKEFRERLKKEGIAPEVVDVLGAASGESVGAARATSGVARAVARTSKDGSRVNRAANRVVEHVDAPRPDRVVSTNVSKPQKKSAGLVGVTAQRVVDKRRQTRVAKEALEAAAKRGQTPASVAPRRAARLDRRVEAREVGNGVRGVLPQDGQVAPRRPAARARAARKQTAVVASVGFRRLERLQNELTRDAESKFRSLSKLEQRAAVHALEGTINVADPKASIAAIDLRIRKIKAQRAALKRDDPEVWAEQYAPLLGKENADEVVQLAKLRQSIVDTPGKVLSPRLAKFVEGEQRRRPRVERVAGDSLRPSTVLARRFAPAGELTGTRAAYAPRRSALERLEKQTPQAALNQIGAEVKRARAKRTPGSSSERAVDLAAEARAVRQYAQGRPLNRKVPAEVLDKLRTVEAERFVRATRTAARQRGLGDIEPVFVKHRKRDTAGAGMRALGGAERGAMAAAKKSDLSLFRRGFRDTSDRAYALGLQESAKRAVQWRMVDELVQDHVPKWSRGKNGKGLTLKQFETAPERKLLDPQDWVAWKAGREEVHPDSDLPTDVDAVGKVDAVPLSDVPSTDWAVRGDRFFALPVEAFNEMKRSHGGSDQISRVGSRLTGVQSQMILGANPAYGIRQVLQTMPLTTVAVGGRVVDAAFWRNLKAYRRAAKVSPDQWNDVLDVLGVRSKSADAVRSVRRADKLDVKRFEGALQHTWGGLFGASARDYFVSPRRSPGAAGTASQVGRTAAKVALTPFRLVRDGNMMLDAWQDRFARTLALAAQDAKMAKGDASRFGERVAASTAEQAKRVGPLAAALSLPEEELAKLARSREFRHMALEAADGVTKWLGDYANYTQREQKIGRAFVPFYGFARHSTRLLVYTLPMEHPFTFAAVLSQSGVQEREKRKMLIAYMKKVGRAGDIPTMLDGLVLTANGGGPLETVDARWLNPLTGPVFEALSSDPATATTGAMTPAVKGLLETAFETNAFTKQRLSNARGQAGPANKLSLLDKGRVVANRVLGSMFPFRAYNDLVNGEKGKLTDTSLPLPGLAQPYPYKDGEAKTRNDQKKQDAAAQGRTERLLDSVVPGRRKPATSLLNSAEYAAETKGQGAAKKKRKGSSGSFGGGGSFGSGSFGGGGGGF